MKIKLLLLQLFISTAIFAQTFTILESDAPGDPSVGGIVDLKSISYAIDESMDSLWFKIELHTTLPGDIGIVFGVDTDLDLQNGLDWNSSNNVDLLPEVVFTVNRNFISPDLLYGFSNNNLNHKSTFGDNDSTIIVNIQLSNLDDDGMFNFVLGASTFDCDTENRIIFDDLPETGFLSIGTTATDAVHSGFKIHTYPNPATDHFYIQSDDHPIEFIDVYDHSGVLIKSIQCQQENIQSINCSHWAEGIYYLYTRSGKKIFFDKLIKI